MVNSINWISIYILQTYFSSHEADKLGSTMDKLNDVKDVMVANIDKLLEREEKIDILV